MDLGCERIEGRFHFIVKEYAGAHQYVVQRPRPFPDGNHLDHHLGEQVVRFKSHGQRHSLTDVFCRFVEQLFHISVSDHHFHCVHGGIQVHSAGKQKPEGAGKAGGEKIALNGFQKGNFHFHFVKEECPRFRAGNQLDILIRLADCPDN